MTVSLGQKTIESQVIERFQAREKYDDAIAAGKGAAILRESIDDQDLHQLDIGNIYPGWTATVEIHLI